MEPQKGVPATSAETTHKVVELRNTREISRAVQYTEDELATHLQLGTTDTESKRLIVETVLGLVKSIGLGQENTELSKAVDTLLETVGELDQAAADLVAGAEAQISELAEQLEQGGPDPQTQLNATLDSICAELRRREQWSDAVRNIQEHLENERDKKKEQLSMISQLLSLGACEDEQTARMDKARLETELASEEGVIGSIIEMLAENDREIGALLSYRQAVELITAGPPTDLIGKPFRYFNNFGDKNNPTTNK